MGKAYIVAASSLSFASCTELLHCFVINSLALLQDKSTTVTCRLRSQLTVKLEIDSWTRRSAPGVKSVTLYPLPGKQGHSSSNKHVLCHVCSGSSSFMGTHINISK